MSVNPKEAYARNVLVGLVIVTTGEKHTSPLAAGDVSQPEGGTMDYAEQTRRMLDNVNGDRITTDGTPSALAALLEANVLATLAVAQSLDRLLGHLEDRN